jgi:hypothetical protein
MRYNVIRSANTFFGTLNFVFAYETQVLARLLISFNICVLNDRAGDTSDIFILIYLEHISFCHRHAHIYQEEVRVFLQVTRI